MPARRSSLAPPGRVLLIALLCAAPCTASEPEDREPIFVSAAVGYHFSSGDYGGSSNTDVSFVPLTLAVRRDRLAVRLIVPYISVSGLEGLVQTGGAVLTDNGSGLGDVTLDGTYTMDPLHVWMPHLDGSVRVKFPSADADRGLGTGEFDYQLELGATRTFDWLTPFVGVGYRFVGEPSDFALNDVWLSSAGATARIAQALSAGLFLFYQQSASASAGDQLDVMPYLEWKITGAWAASSYATAGLQDGSPDFGVGLQLSYEAGF